MRLNFFWITANDSHAAEQELNRFLAARRVIKVDKVFCHSDNPGWSVCVEWLAESVVGAGDKARPGKVDYREVLDEPTFRIFAALRSWRKEIAAEQAIPVYGVASNEQLAAIARERMTTKAALKKLSGFGDARMSKYADGLLACAKQTIDLQLEETVRAGETV